MWVHKESGMVLRKECEMLSSSLSVSLMQAFKNRRSTGYMGVWGDLTMGCATRILEKSWSAAFLVFFGF